MPKTGVGVELHEISDIVKINFDWEIYEFATL